MTQTRVEGYLVAVESHGPTGLARLLIAERPNAAVTRRPGKLTQAYIEAGAGLRQLIAFYGGPANMIGEAPKVRLEWTLNGRVVESFRPVELN